MCIICGHGKCLPFRGEKSKKKKDPEIGAFKKVEASPNELFDEESY
jgi:hypothetical protein